MTSARSRSSPSKWTDGWILGFIWLLATATIVTWLALDQAPPAWDQGDHLTRAMNHWRVLQHPQWFLGEWWRELWQQAPTKRGPLIYLLTAPIFTGLGPGFDRAIYVNLLFTAVLLGATYAIGRRICSPAVGLWAAGLSLLSPVLLRLQKDYLQDFPLTATVTLMVMVMTYFWLSEKSTLRWGMAILWGVTVGLTLLTRTSGLLFVVPPIGWMLGVSLWQRQWLKLGQVILGTAVGVLTLWPWFSTSWLTIISTTLESNAYGVVYADNPQANTLAGWLFYPKALPQMMSWPLFALAAIAWLLILVQLLTQRHRPQAKAGLIKLQSGLWGHRQGILWLLAIIFGVYILFSLGSNKVLRFVIPCLPLLWVVLVQGIVAIQNRGWHYLRWSAVSLAMALSVTQLFFGGDAPRQLPDQLAWPNQAVINEIVETIPLLKTTLGLAVNTAEINPFNMDFYGAIADFQVFARQLSLDPKTALQDSQALDWYLAKTGDQGAYDTIEAGQQKLLEAIETSRDLSLHKTWPLPDGSTLQLYHRNQPPITVKRIAVQDNQPVSLHRVDGSPQVVSGQPYPITYTLRGPGAALQAGLLLLTWEPLNPSVSPVSPIVQSPQWIGDHAIGLGYLKTDGVTVSDGVGVEVVERLSTTPPQNLPGGTYRLKATYLNRETGVHYSLSDNAMQVEVVPPTEPLTQTEFQAESQNLLSYFQSVLAPKLAGGELDPIFYEVGRINQYDPQQDYLRQAEQAMNHRLSQFPQNLDWLYTLTLAQVLQQKAPEATATLKTVTDIAPENPYHWAYLGFVYLYRWQPGKAHHALAEAEKRQPDLPNLKLLQTVNAVMGLNFPRAIHLLRSGV